MKNNIAAYKKSRSSEVKVWAKFNAKINSTSIFSQIVTKLLISRFLGWVKMHFNA